MAHYTQLNEIERVLIYEGKNNKNLITILNTPWPQ